MSGRIFLDKVDKFKAKDFVKFLNFFLGINLSNFLFSFDFRLLPLNTRYSIILKRKGTRYRLIVN